MFLEQIDIVNFRGIAQLTLKLDETTVLIGENNTGKSTVLEALQMCLSRSLTRKGGVFSEYDYHLKDKGSQPVESDAISLTLRFAEQSDGEWPDEVSQVIPDVVQVGADGLQRVILRVNSSFDDVTADFATTWDFLDLAGNALVAAKAPRNIISLQQFSPVFYLAALRDSAQEFRPRSQFWGPFVRSLKIDPTLRQELEDELAQLNEKVLSANESFAMVKERLGRTGEMVPLDSDTPVSIEAIPGKVFDILSRTQVMLTSITGARLPIGRHGEGTQSLAVICLFDAFLKGRLADSYTEFTSPILALEEPEAHLHPSAIRAACILLRDLPGQKIMATHSGDLVSGFSLSSLRRFRRKNGVVSVHQVRQDTSLSADDIRKLDYHVRSDRGSLLFARCWLLVEGETDWFVLSESAAICGYDLVSEGISLVPFAQVGVETFVKAADQLGIEWIVVADGDQEGSVYLNRAKDHIGDREANFTGAENDDWAGGVSGPSISAQGNILVGPTVVSAPLEAFQEVMKRPGAVLSDGLVAALEAGAMQGGDHRCPREQAAQSAFLAVARTSDQGDTLSRWLTVPPQGIGEQNPVTLLRQAYDRGESSPVEVKEIGSGGLRPVFWVLAALVLALVLALAVVVFWIVKRRGRRRSP